MGRQNHRILPDDSLLAAARKERQDATETIASHLTKFKDIMAWSTEDAGRIVCTREIREGFLKGARALVDDRKAVLERIAKGKPHP